MLSGLEACCNMKIAYCHCSLYNPGGMERVLLNKVSWIQRHYPDAEIVVVTTDQQGRPPFYGFPAGVRLVDLGINYSLDNDKPVYNRIISYLRKRRLHRSRLTELLMTERPDITISLYPSESSFIPDINDGSKKVLELHFNRYFRLQYGRKGLLGLIDRYRSYRDVALARRFDRFVVLTDEDCTYWGKMPNLEVIPNAALPMPVKSDCMNKRVIAVGRLDFQKGFDRLINAWTIVKRNPVSEGWCLDIFGQGEWNEMLLNMVKDNELLESVHINPPTGNISKEYASSSILAMTSHYEGFPMVMIEGMSAGLPVVTFDFKCGPRDIIINNENGLIVKQDNIAAFAQGLLSLMKDDSKRIGMGKNAMGVVGRYSEDKVMAQWMNLFNELCLER